MVAALPVGPSLLVPFGWLVGGRWRLIVGLQPAHGVVAVEPFTIFELESCVELSLVVWHAVKDVEKYLIWKLLATSRRY